jgi:Mlc titration factor MtfA (ptsG expression regulator)
MISMIQNWWRSRIIKRSPVQEQQWARAFRQLPILHGLSAQECTRLRELAILFLHHKSLEGAHGVDVTQHMALIIALQACLPILNLGLRWYDGWVSVIIYPAEFVPDRVYVDENGLEHQSSAVLSGESWSRGPVVLSWEGSQHAGIVDGHNVVVHEFAHKLDGLNGSANGFPPLHKNMHKDRWSSAMTRAFNDFRDKVNAAIPLPIDDYAATSPAEFFAVFSEEFFERPHIVHSLYPEVYDQFKQFYRQDPLVRLSAGQSR